MRLTLRVFTIVALTLLAAPHAAEAQSEARVWRVGYLGSGSQSVGESFVEAFRQGLRALGYVDGQHITIESRWGHGKVEALPSLAEELVRLNVDVLFVGTTAAALAARDATKTVPIVFAGVADPVGAGLVPNLARPGGNVTGLATSNIELVSKRLELVRDVSRGKVKRLAYVFNPADASNVLAGRELESPARALGITLRPLALRNADQLDRDFSMLASERVEAVYVAGGPLTNEHARAIAQLAVRNRLLSIHGNRTFVEAGGLMSYATDFPHLNRRAAIYVDRILKGAKPGDLPVEQPTKFELVINMKTAKALGLTIPPTLLLRADQVIE